MRDFAAFVDHRELHAMAFVDELLRVLDLDPQIMRPDFETQAHFLEIVRMGLLARLLLFFLLVVNVLAVIHDAADWRLGFRRDLDEIELYFERLGAPLIRGHDSQLIAGRSDHTDRLGLDLMVDAKSLCDGNSPLKRVLQSRSWAIRPNPASIDPEVFSHRTYRSYMTYRSH